DSSSILSPRAPLAPARGARGDKMLPSPRAGRGARPLFCSEVTPSGRTRLFGFRHAPGASGAGPATGIRRPAHSFGHPPAARAAWGRLRCGLGRPAPGGVLGCHGRTVLTGEPAPSGGRRGRVRPPGGVVPEHGP